MYLQSLCIVWGGVGWCGVGVTIRNTPGKGDRWRCAVGGGLVIGLG